jgi:hypothetical protein
MKKLAKLKAKNILIRNQISIPKSNITRSTTSGSSRYKIYFI